MNDSFIVSQWAQVRRSELVDIPDNFAIHPDFLQSLTRQEFEEAFREIGTMFRQMYTDMAREPERFGLPLYKEEEYGYFTSQAREARKAPWYLGHFLLCIFACGEFSGDGASRGKPSGRGVSCGEFSGDGASRGKLSGRGVSCGEFSGDGVSRGKPSEDGASGGDFGGAAFLADTAEIRRLNQAKKTNILLKALHDYGFVFSVIKNYSLTSGSTLEIDYPDNRNLLQVLSLVAKKVRDTQLKDVKNVYSPDIAFGNAFIGWNYKILAEDLHICSLGEDSGYVADKMHAEADRETVLAMDKILMQQGYTRWRAAPNEGPSLRYYRGAAKTHAYALTSDKGQLYLELRIRNAQDCVPYLQEYPERIAEIFRHSDTGCKNRFSGACKCGVRYTFEGEEKWHCGCCGAPFQIRPVTEDIPHYLKLMEQGGR